MHRTSEIRKVLILTLVCNLLVSSAKMVYGYITNSIAILSDGFHSLFDGASNILGLVGIHIASHPPDESHPYGHRKYETVFTIFIGALMFMTCLEIFKRVYASLQGRSEVIVTGDTFILMLVTLGINLFVAIYEKRKGRRLNSEFLIADAKHTQSDIYVTFGVIASLVFTKLGYTYADPIAGVIVGIIVAKAGISIIKESTEVLVDSTRTDTGLITDIVRGVEGVKGCHEVRTRGTDSHVFVDVHVLVDPSMTVRESHIIADRVEEEIKKKIPEVVDVVVHIEPFR